MTCLAVSFLFDSAFFTLGRSMALKESHYAFVLRCIFLFNLLSNVYVEERNMGISAVLPEDPNDTSDPVWSNTESRLERSQEDQ